MQFKTKQDPIAAQKAIDAFYATQCRLEQSPGRTVRPLSSEVVIARENNKSRANKGPNRKEDKQGKKEPRTFCGDLQKMVLLLFPIQ